MAKKNKDVQSTGTAGAGTSWSHPLATETEDGARIVYVAVPNEDTLRLTEEYHRTKMEREPRINALTTALGMKMYASDRNVDDLLRDAAKVEEYIRNGTVPEQTETPDTEGPAEPEEEA